MVEWYAIAEWPRCREMASPGIVFELKNAEGQTLVTPCVAGLPPVPFDWVSPAIAFRPVPEPVPRHSTPIPPPPR